MSYRLYLAIGSEIPNHLNDFKSWSLEDFKQIFFSVREFMSQEELDGFLDGLRFADLRFIRLENTEYNRIQSILDSEDAVQNFIEENYPNYSGGANIGCENDLHKLLFEPEEVQQGDCAYDTLLEICNPLLNSTNWVIWKTLPICVNRVEAQYYKLRTEILETAIVNSFK